MQAPRCETRRLFFIPATLFKIKLLKILTGMQLFYNSFGNYKCRQPAFINLQRFIILRSLTVNYTPIAPTSGCFF